MIHHVFNLTIKSVEPVYAPGTKQPIVPVEQQIGKRQYKNGTVGNKYAEIHTKPAQIGKRLIMASQSDVFVNRVFLTEELYSDYEDLIKDAEAAGGWKKLGLEVELESFTANDLPDFYWCQRDDNRNPIAGTPATDKNGNLYPSMNSYTFLMEVRDGKPTGNIQSHALRVINQIGVWADQVASHTNPDQYQQPPIVQQTGGYNHQTGLPQ